MIAITNKTLSDNTVSRLLSYQKLVDEKVSFPEKIEEAKRVFKQTNKKGNIAFDEVKAVLADMCQGPERCHYCEDSKADEVEHIRPKDWFPEQCFSWDNYCYACGPCNGPKNNRYAILRESDGIYQELVRKSGEEVVPPPKGRDILINPRIEDPTSFLFLDLINKQYVFTEIHDKGSQEYTRAHYTIEILGLNSRSYLVRARKIAYNNFKARLTEYVHQKQRGVEQEVLEGLVTNLKEEHHQTVWQEMKRQYEMITELKTLFQIVPEALTW